MLSIDQVSLWLSMKLQMLSIHQVERVVVDIKWESQMLSIHQVSVWLSMKLQMLSIHQVSVWLSISSGSHKC